MMHSNNVCHFAIHADDVDRAKAFYQRVFGWQFDEWGPPDFYLIRTGQPNDPGILGALQKRTQPLGAGFNGYECSISVENVKNMEAAILEHGGQIVMKPVEIPTVGVLIKFIDTEGNIACAIQYFKKGEHG
jgi:predicted enzyme related to lactoylglutathione lyase